MKKLINAIKSIKNEELSVIIALTLVLWFFIYCIPAMVLSPFIRGVVIFFIGVVIVSIIGSIALGDKD